MSALTDIVRAQVSENEPAKFPGNTHITTGQKLNEMRTKALKVSAAYKMRETKKALECGKLYRRIAEARRRNKKTNETQP